MQARGTLVIMGATSVVASVALSVAAAALLRLQISPATAAFSAAACAALLTFGAYKRVTGSEIAIDSGLRAPWIWLAALVAGSLAALVFQPGVWSPQSSEQALMISGAVLSGTSAFEAYRAPSIGRKARAALIVIMSMSALLLAFGVARAVA